MSIIELRTTIHAPIARCFDLSRSIDLHRSSFSNNGEQAIEGITTGLIGLNESVTWRARHFFIWFRMKSTITHFSFPNYFKDVMLKGSFKRIEHQHLFEEKDGVTVMHDYFEFEAPLGLIGKAVEKFFLTNYLKTLMEKRNQKIKETAESGEWKAHLPLLSAQSDGLRPSAERQAL